ncbi:PAS domain S-box protein [Alteromonas sp. 1_MG-2023]|uniref:PAS domain-containing hybrid sensor histidine kinase/response regulator n=1 Tax=Alteromonas sp. 1_MG-2023 TaxID=3062669 RepID=UPI0026E18852|nr:PAS domain S-box protein [Alteromonas sp. 1_MG-2023]MDO6475701.1 PAS domain S-box protein [Alteromonas sp. 1_MG-2023]
MHRLLFRQIKKTMGFQTIEEAEQWLDTLLEHALDDSLPPAVQTLLQGLMPFVDRVDTSYKSHERDMEIRDRSIRLSSQELTESLELARRDAVIQKQAVRELKIAANDLLKGLAKPELSEDTDSLNGLAELMADLARERNEALHEVEVQRRAIDQHAIIVVVDNEKQILFANSKFCEISGYEEKELNGKSLEIIRSGYHDESFYSPIWRAVRAGEVWHGEVHNLRKNGETFWVSSTIVPIEGNTGQAERYVAIMTDITHQKLLEERVSDSQRFYQSITDSIGEGIFAVDRSGTIEFLNPEASRLLGWTMDELKNRRFHDTVQFQSPDKKFIPVQQSPLIQTIKKGEIYFSEETYFTHKNGLMFPVSITAVPLEDDRGNIRGHVGVFRNISERKNIEQAMRDAFSQAERANNAKSEFLANMSHEIRTPLNAVLGLTHLVLNSSLSTQQKDYLQKATNSANTLLGIINDILDYSKIEAGKLDLDIQPFIFDDLLEKVSNLFQDRAVSKGLLLLFDMGGDMSLPLLGDENRLMQIFNNLVSNAVKFTRQGQIIVSVELQPRQGQQVSVKLRVTDTGIGLSDAHLQKLFDPFTQADASISRQYGGTGLGMSITRHLVEQMNGTISVESAPGEGSTFSIDLVLPLAGTSNTMPPLGAHQFLTLCCLNEALLPVVGLVEKTLSTLMVPHEHCTTHRTESLPEQTTHLLVVADKITEERMKQLAEAFRSKQLDYSHLRILTPGNQEEMRHLLISHGLSDAAVMQLPFTQRSMHDFLNQGAMIKDTQTGFTSLDDIGLVERRLSGKHVLITDSDDISQTVMSQQLNSAGIKATCVSSGADCITLCKQLTFDAIILNNKLPDIPGWEVAESLVFGNSLTTPIICTSTEDASAIEDLISDSGMCALLTKPVSNDDLLRTLDNYMIYKGEEEHAGNDYDGIKDPYASLLQSFYRKYSVSGNTPFDFLVEGLQQQSSVPVEILAGIRKDASAIGAKPLKKMLGALLQQDTPAELVHAAIPKLAGELDMTLKKVVASLDALSNVEEKQENEQDFTSQVQFILNLLEDYDAKASDNLQQLYSEHQQSPHRWVLQQAIQKVSQYDFEAAAVLLQPLVNGQ